jgi:anti-anti-sigma regulatory factor
VAVSAVRSELDTEPRLEFSGRLDVRAARRLKRMLAGLEPNSAPCAVLDLSAVTEIDAVVLGAILAADSAFAQAGRALEIVPPRGAAAAALELLGADDRLSFRRAENHGEAACA